VAPGALAQALAAAQAGGQAPGQPANGPQGSAQQAAPAPDATPDSITPNQATLLSQQGSNNLALMMQQQKEAAAEIKALREAYKGPYILASDLFARVPMPSQGHAAAMGEDYVLGVGDQLMLSVFGSATFELPMTVDRRGDVVVPKVGAVHLAGQSLGTARLTVHRLLAKDFSNVTIDLQVAAIRDVRIFILGEVYRPGSYLVPSMSSLVNLLMMAGGPSPVGTYRNVEVIRDNHVIHTLDLYALRLNGKGIENVLLKDGDTLFVPMTGVKVLMQGAFVRVATSPQNKDFPGVLVELKPQETALDAVNLIGGLTPSAFQTLLTLQRKGPDGVVNVQDLSTTPSALAQVKIYPEDVLTALHQAARTENVVEVKGYARVPGQYAFHPGMRVKDLLTLTNQLQPDTYLGRGEIVRTLPDETKELLAFNLAHALRGDAGDNLALAPRDVVTLYPMDSLRLPRTVTVTGPFTTPGTYPWYEDMRASDLVFRAGVPKLDADRYRAELAHMKDGKVSQVVTLDLSKLLTTEHQSPVNLTGPTINPMVQPYDTLTLYEKPDFKIHRSARIEGMVQHPGTYVFTDETPTLSKLIARAGGLLPGAMPEAGVFLRMMGEANATLQEASKESGLSAHDPTANGINEILSRLNETKRDPRTGELLKNPILHGLLSGNLNRMVVDFPAALKGDAQADVELRDGDQIIIPRKMDSAYVVGEAASPFANYKVASGMKVRDLLKLAGGITRNADRWNIRLLKADGRIEDSWVMGKPVGPGDTVLVPQRFRRDTSWQENLAALTPIAVMLNVLK
jgi:protein involved in polysaccharide export with SLBB domain